MSFCFNKIIFTQKWPAVSTLLFLSIFSLFCSTTIFAQNHDVDDQSQLYIMQLLGNGTPSCVLPDIDAKKFKDLEGHCFGFSAMWAYSKWLQFVQSEKVNIPNYNDSTWYKNTITDILGAWSDCDNIKKFAFLIKKFQDSQSGTFEKEVNQFVDTNGKKTQREYSIASLLTLEQLKQLLRENIIHDHKLIFIFSHNHATALFKDRNDYYYFDPNASNGEYKVSSTDNVAELVFEAIDFDPIKPSPLALQVFSFDEKERDYPNQQEVLDRIHPALVCESNYADETTGLQMAALCGCLESVLYFLNKNPSVDLYDKNGRTALLFAVNSGHLGIILLLLDKGANHKVIDIDGCTLLMYAASSGHLEVVSLLLEKGADPNMIDKDGKRAITYAVENNHPEIAQEIEKAIKAKKLQRGVKECPKED
jgi:hypothetical protein